MDQFLDRLAATTPPDRAVVIGCALVALCALLADPIVRYTRHLVTLLHEGGHAVVALLAGRSLHGIRLHSDASGLSVSRGRPSGPGMVATLLAGYLTPALAGLAGAYAVPAGWSNAYLWAMVLVCALLLLQIRNLHGLVVVVVSGVTIGLVGWYAPDQVRSALATTLTWFLLFSGPWGMAGLFRARRRPGGQGSDVDQLARITPLPATGWWTLMTAVTLAVLGLGARALLVG